MSKVVRAVLVLFAVLSGLAVASRTHVEVVAQEQVTLGTPITQSQTGWDLSSMLLDVDHMRIIIRLRAVGNTGTSIEKVYDGATGDVLLRQLNKANLSTRSLIQRTYDRLIADGVISGSVTGTPR